MRSLPRARGDMGGPRRMALRNFQRKLGVCTENLIRHAEVKLGNIGDEDRQEQVVM